jgi:hypothetical protein
MAASLASQSYSFSSEADAGSRKETRQNKSWSPALIPSKRE